MGCFSKEVILAICSYCKLNVSALIEDYLRRSLSPVSLPRITDNTHIEACPLCLQYGAWRQMFGGEVTLQPGPLEGYVVTYMMTPKNI